MGRQQHLTRLAFGRSPYGDPIRDENGNFIINSYAGLRDDVGYKQDLDEKGHPRNLVSEQISRRFRRAQNSVLAVTGVVQRKGEAQKSEWERLQAKEKVQRVVRENQEGKVLKGFHRALANIIPWPIYALRCRLMCFPLYANLPLFNIARFEHNFIGIGKCMTAGLIPQLLTIPPRMYRHYVRDPDVEDIVNYVDPSRYVPSDFEDILFSLAHLPCFAFEIPLQVFSALQSLLIVQQETWPSLLFFIPFSRFSPIAFPLLPKFSDISDVIIYMAECAQTPLVLTVVRDYLHAQLGYRLYAFLRQILSRPDNPDISSIRSFAELEELDDTSVPGLGRAHVAVDDNHVGRYYGPRSFWGAFRIAFPVLYKILDFCSFSNLSKSRGRVSISLERSLISRIQASLISSLEWEEHRPQVGGIADTFRRRLIMYQEFHMLDLDPDQELVEPYAWIDAVLRDYPNPATESTPEIARLIDVDDLAEGPGPSQTGLNAGNVTESQPMVSEPEPEQQIHSGDLTWVDNALANPIIDVDGQSNGSHPQVISVNSLTELLSAISDQAEGNQRADAGLPLDLQRQDIDAETNDLDEQPGESYDQPGIGGGHLNPPTLSGIQTPIPGISRAVSLSEIPFSQFSEIPTQPRRVRRPTEVGDTGLDTDQAFDIDAMLLASGFTPVIQDDNNHDITNTVDDPFREINEIEAFLETDRPATEGSNPYVNLRDVPQNDTRPLSPPSESSSTSQSLSSHHDDADYIPRDRRHRHPYRHRNSTRMPFSIPARRVQYRTTLLSTFAADSLAWHLSSLLTSMILLPFEIYYLRSISAWFLDLARRSSSNGDDMLVGMIDESGTIGAINEVMFGGQLRYIGQDRTGGWGSVGMFVLRYLGKIVAVFGVEALMRGSLWWWGTQKSMRKGKNMFGWGKF